MKRGTPSHPKTLALAAALELPAGPVSPETAAAGLLEKLWHYAGTYARRGNVGRHGDPAIARAAGWVAEPGRFIRALVQTGWLDECSCHRLRIHDWPQHADQAVSRTEEVKREGFLECYGAVTPLRGTAFTHPPSQPAAGATGGPAAAAASSPPLEPAASRKLDTSSEKLDASSLPLPVPVPEPTDSPPGPPARGGAGFVPVQASAATSTRSPPSSAGSERRRRARQLRDDADRCERHWIALGGYLLPEDRRMVRDALRGGLPVERLLGSICERVRDQLIDDRRLAPTDPWPPPGLAPFDPLPLPPARASPAGAEIFARDEAGLLDVKSNGRGDDAREREARDV